MQYTADAHYGDWDFIYGLVGNYTMQMCYMAGAKGVQNRPKDPIFTRLWNRTRLQNEFKIM